MLSSLHDFIERLEHLRDLQQVSVPVAPAWRSLPFPADQQLSQRRLGPVVSAPDEYPFPVATNLFAHSAGCGWPWGWTAWKI